jgi:hypothetical protein
VFEAAFDWREADFRNPFAGDGLRRHAATRPAAIAAPGDARPAAIDEDTFYRFSLYATTESPLVVPYML